MYFDGAAHRDGAGAGVVFVTSEGEVLPHSFTLTKPCSNNVAEYQALILWLEMSVDLKELQLKVYGDSKFVINQLLGNYEVKKPEFVQYYNYNYAKKRLLGWLGDVTIEHFPRKENRQVDALARLASTLALPKEEAKVSIGRTFLVPLIFDDEDDNEGQTHAITVSFLKKKRKRSCCH